MGDDLDRLLDEVEQLLLPESERKSASTKKEENKRADLNENLDENGKCYTTYLGPKNSRSANRACSALRCIQCDFTVVEFPLARWRIGTDYMFLRTNMPHAWKLARQLEPCADAVAYGCQCSHHTALKLQPLKNFPALQWVCRGHQTTEK